MDSWKLPLMVAAIALPITAAFVVGGPGVGVAAGALVGVTILVIAARQRPRGPIVPVPAREAKRHVLLVMTCSVDEPGAIREIARAGRLDEAPREADVLALAPAKTRFLDRWASDVEPSRRDAQRGLVATVAALAKAGIAAEARVGDEDVIQAVEDQLQSFPASEVILVTGGDEGEDTGVAAAAELRSRLQTEFRHVVVSAPEDR